MSDVYRAQQQSRARLVAVKILKPELAENENGVKRFVREAKAAAQLVHPNIVHIYEVNCIDGLWFIAQEYVPGLNLHAFLQKHGPLSPRQVTLILWQVALALQKASQSGIVHRDIKPDNILLSDSGEMKVADFGLAHVGATLTDEKASLTQTGMTLGTPLYMSPEQAEGKPLDHRSDIYSLGITAYQLLSGSPPFRGDTAISTALLHLNKAPEPLQYACPDAPPKLIEIVHRMIEKSPDKRYQTIPNLLDDIKSLLKESFEDTLDSTRFNHVGGTNGWNSDPGISIPIPLVETDGSLHQAMRHLEQSMRLEKLSHGPKRSPRWIVFYTICALLFGVLLAFAKMHASTPHFPPPDGDTVPKMDSIAAQWITASQLGTEEGWKSVISYEGEESAKSIWGYKAKQQLAIFYMKKNESEKAFEIFLSFADQPDYEPYAKSFGWAGLFWYYAKWGYPVRTNEALTNFLTVSSAIPSHTLDEPTNFVFDEATSLMRRKEK